MKPRIGIITLGVNDMEKSLKFYRDGLGLPTRGIVGTEFKRTERDAAGAVAMFEMQDGQLLALYPRMELLKDSNVKESGRSSIEFSLGYFSKDEAEVDRLVKKAAAAGAIVTDPPRKRPWGIYSGYFKDPDGHLWEIIWDPRTNVGE